MWIGRRIIGLRDQVIVFVVPPLFVLLSFAAPSIQYSFHKLKFPADLFSFSNSSKLSFLKIGRNWFVQSLTACEQQSETCKTSLSKNRTNSRLR